MFTGSAISTGKVDESFFYIVAISVALLVVVTVTMITFLFRYNRKRHPEPEKVGEPLWLEIIWTAVPTVLALSMFYYGWVNFDFIRTPPKDAINVNVVGREWSWLFTYDNGKQSDVLRVPLNKPVKLILNSADVIHSLYIPAFRIKEDCVPGMKTYLWFNADEAGTYDIFCTEYCGVGHSHMLSKVIVMRADEYEKWYSASESGGLAAEGMKIAQEKGCLGCHSTDGSRMVGPSFKGLHGKVEVVIRDGKEMQVTVDDEFLEHYIEHPNVDIIKGYPPIMPAIPLKEAEIKALVEYIKTVK
ncbi:MAG TPA: cytochrome c oxidase subunit II [Dissulfurispiraceae bacterium]|nr:cytochrome c oxidase subunit II [Dissulfurispiraceae bacterium]